MRNFFDCVHSWRLLFLNALIHGLARGSQLRKTPFQHISSLPYLILLCVFLTACGGGGGGGGESRTSPPPPPSPTLSTATKVVTHSHGEITVSEYRKRRDQLASRYRSHPNFSNQYGLGLINAEVAYANLELKRGATEASAPGGGVKVGIIDSGIDQNSPAFNQNLISESHLSGSMDETPANWRSINSSSHGTAVASIISNVKGSDVWSGYPGIQNVHFHGISWGVTLEMISIPLGTGSGSYTPISLSVLRQQDRSQNAIFANALSKSIDFLNLSFGYAGTISAYSE